MRTRFLVIVVLVLGWAISPAAGAPPVAIGVEQLAQVAKVVVRGRVVKQESRWNANRTQIVTLTTIAVLETMKGRPSRQLVVEQPGGQVGDRRMYVSGAVTFQPLTDYVLFLEPSKAEAAHYGIVGTAQGAYLIQRDARTGMESVVLPTSEGTQGGLPGEIAAGRRARAATIPLTQFRLQVERSLSQALYIPSGTTLSVVIHALESSGVGRVQVRGRTLSDVTPSPGVVIPAGSAVEGTAQRVGEKWLIRWTNLSVNNTSIRIVATNEELTGGSLRGRTLLVKLK